MAKRYKRWETIRDLPEGGQGHIYVVVDTTEELPGEFVLKRLKNPGRIDLFEREIKAAQLLDHPNVLRIVEFDLAADKPYYVAEYCKGGSLDRVGADQGNIREAVRILLPIVDALSRAHDRHIFHRDVKPANILFRADGTPVLGDFGICHVEGDQRVTLSEEAMGSRDYIAPEMESGRHGPVTGAVDVYALGKVLYWMLSGGKIFAREDHRRADQYLPEVIGDQRFEHVHALLEGMIVEDPAKRHPITRLGSLMERVVELIEGRFTPLRRSLKPQCRFCGIGRYEALQTVERGHVDWLGGLGLHALRCNYCGHVEVFQLHAIENMTWWDDETRSGTAGTGPALPPPVASEPRQKRAESYQWGGVDWPLTENFWSIVKSVSAGAFDGGTASPTLLDAAIGDPLCGNSRCRREIWPYATTNTCPACDAAFQLELAGMSLVPNEAKLRLKRDVYGEARAAYMRGEL